MKCYLFLILLFGGIVYSQVPKDSRYRDDELFFYQDGGKHYYKLTPILEAVWDKTGLLRSNDKWGQSVFDPKEMFLMGYVGTVTSNNGMDYILSSETDDVPVFGNSNYKVACYSWPEKNELAHFYLDFRDCNYVDGWSGYNDFTIKYLHSTNKFYIAEGKGVPFNYNGFIEVTNTQQRIWDIEGIVSWETECFELYLSLSNQSGKPHLSWNPYHSTNILGYNLYKKLTTASGTIASVIFTTSTEYIDTNFEIDPKFGSDYVEYWVKAKINSSLESLESNHCTTKGDSYIQWKMNEGNDLETKIISEYLLNPNYPNPFNPSTNITYQLPKKGHVVLKIYNTLGKEVSELVNETKEEGTYSVTINGENLPSGLYFYKIQSNEFVDVKKMLLLK